MAEYRHEAVEVCPHCMGENTVPDWAPSDGYRVNCSHCGESILLCDECMHSKDNPRHICDWDSECKTCFRDYHLIIGELTNKISINLGASWG